MDYLQEWAEGMPEGERDLALSMIERVRAAVGDGNASSLDSEAHSSRIISEVAAQQFGKRPPSQPATRKRR